MAKGEVHPSKKGASTSIGPVPSTAGGRNRLRGGASDTGSAPSKPSGSADKGAMAGSYDPSRILGASALTVQDQYKSVGKDPRGAKAPFEPTVQVQRDLTTPEQRDPKGGPGSSKQGPEGDFGGLPGQTGSKRADVFRSMV